VIWISLNDHFRLPAEIVTQTVAVLAKRRAGKSYLARRLVEGLAGAGLQVVIVDPKGDWWGVRSSADGKSPGLPFTILGGERGDVPLERAGGELVAKLVVEERVSALLDLSLFRKSELATFMADFLEALYRLKALERHRTALMLVIDEADAIAPQKPDQKGDQLRMLGAAEDIVRRGGQRGLGCTLISQRSAVLNKNVLTQAEILIALRTISPQDRAALDAWVEVHGEREQRETLMASLPSLPTGDAWVWSPGWPSAGGIFERIHVGAIATFDSGATPKPGEKIVEPKSVAEVDLARVRAQMAEVMKRAEEADPKRLRARIAALERELAAKPAPSPAFDRAVLDRAIQEGRAYEQRKTAQLEARLQDVRGRFRDVERLADAATAAISELATALGKLAVLAGRELPAPEIPKAPRAIAEKRKSLPASSIAPLVAAGLVQPALEKGPRAVLISIAQHVDGVSRVQIGTIAGYKRSTRNLYLQQLARAGFIAENGGRLHATAAGLAALGDFERLPTGHALLKYWLERLPEGERRTLEVVASAAPGWISRDAVGDGTGYQRSTRNLYLQQLVRRGLIETQREGVRLSPTLAD